MLHGLPLATSRRAWFVPEISIWGLPTLSDLDFLVLEEVNATSSIGYGSASVGDASQEILYSQLTDHRGNNLPSSLASPAVLPRPRDHHAVFVVGRESSDRFRIARDPSADGPVTTDLMIVEMGD